MQPGSLKEPIVDGLMGVVPLEPSTIPLTPPEPLSPRTLYSPSRQQIYMSFLAHQAGSSWRQPPIGWRLADLPGVAQGGTRGQVAAHAVHAPARGSGRGAEV